MDKKLVISLIQDNLVFTKLTDGLRSINLGGDSYDFHLADTILKIMEIEIPENALRVYFNLYKQVEKIHAGDTKRLNDLSEEIYNFLRLMKK